MKTKNTQRAWNGAAAHQSNGSVCDGPLHEIQSLRLSFFPSSALFFGALSLSSLSLHGSPSPPTYPPLSRWLSLFHAKAVMSRRNRFAGLLWSRCYDSFILSHIPSLRCSHPARCFELGWGDMVVGAERRGSSGEWVMLTRAPGEQAWHATWSGEAF